MHYEVRVRLAMFSQNQQQLEKLGEKIEALIREEWEIASKSPSPIIIDGEITDVKKSYRQIGSLVPDQRTHRTGGRKSSRRIVRMSDD